MYLCPESLIVWAFRAFSIFRGLGGLGCHQPASHGGDHIAPWQLFFAHPCPARICQKRGNAKKYPLPDSTTSFNENNLAGTFAAPSFVLFPLEWLTAIPADYIDLPRCSDDSAAARADIFDTSVNGFLTSALGSAFHRQAAGVDLVLAQGFLIHASASGASVVTVQPYLACFSICRPWASAVALNFWLW